MKIIAILCSVLFTASAFAASITVTSDSTKEKQELVGLPVETIGLLNDAGLRKTDLGNGVFQWRKEKLNCKITYHHGLGSEEALSGVPEVKCNFKDGRAMGEILNKIETYSTGLMFTDCAMGKCFQTAKVITCTVDTKIEVYSEGRFSCTYEDEQ